MCIFVPQYGTNMHIKKLVAIVVIKSYIFFYIGSVFVCLFVFPKQIFREYSFRISPGTVFSKRKNLLLLVILSSI